MIPARAPSVVTPPAVEPVTAAETREWAGVDSTAAPDSLVNGLIVAAREAAESYTGRSFITRTLSMPLDARGGRVPDWLPAGTYHLPYDYFDGERPREIELPRGPVISITSVTTHDAAGLGTVLASPSYALYGKRLSLAPGYSWPSGLRPRDSGFVVYQAGYGPSPSDVPRSIRTAILMGVQELLGSRATAEMPAGVKTLKAGDSTITRFDDGGGAGGHSLPSSALLMLAPFRDYRV